MKNEILELKCIDMSVDGQGICKDNGLVVFVKGMILDEVAKVKIISDKKNMAFGIIDEMIKPSPYRIKSLCPISYKCGGCDYRYIDYDYQLVLKKRQLEQTFKNFNLDVKVDDVIKCDDPMYYRNKTQVPVREHQFGFYRKYSNDIVEFDECYIETRLANDILRDLKKELLSLHLDNTLRHILIKHALGTGEVMIGLIVNDFNVDYSEVADYITSKYKNIKSIILNLNNKDTNVILGNEEKVLFGNDFIIDEFEGIQFKISLKSFYQVNYHQMIKLYKQVEKKADINNESRVLDLYSGIGTISLFLARKAKEVTGVEVVEPAVNNAIENAKMNNINNANFILGDARDPMDKYLKDKDVVIVDPPRKGLNESLINSIINSNINKVVYVSCNPATLARDLTLLKDTYNIGNITPVDMFPYTTHVESVVLLTRI
ncbi:MAG: 23S rRNA (uracil(1939)-C(5))-methyltransferase RlmD [Erysipelotrichaceae bacterium]|nr:23S rRNA (uracil(1939)-C(5))-methyltransferase RlmD [Erysipelotrichaceae bacterium]